MEIFFSYIKILTISYNLVNLNKSRSKKVFVHQILNNDYKISILINLFSIDKLKHNRFINFDYY
jgi:Leucine-rich repeat (LRR) protein